MAPSAIRLPKADDRTAVIGRTGSGKTQFAVWLLSLQAFDTMPWVVIDYKGDELINGIERAIHIGYDEIPVDPGIYVLKVLPGDEQELSDWFRQVWQNGGIGIYVDEGYMIGQRDRYFNACLTQGRSKEIPMIILSQRPLWLSRFVFSEAGYFVVFDVTHVKDRNVIKEYVDESVKDKIDERMPEYHSHYYDVGKSTMITLGPVPDGDTLLANIDAKLPKKRRNSL